MKIFVSLRVQDMEDGADEQVMRGEIPVVATALPVGINEHVCDELRISNIGEGRTSSSGLYRADDPSAAVG